jgi:hypothetical protein
MRAPQLQKQETNVLLRISRIICREAKTDDQLKEIMKSHPSAPNLIHGFYHSTDVDDTPNEWRSTFPDNCWGHPDGLYLEGGVRLS